MGLDVIAYSRVQRVADCPEDPEEVDGICIYPEEYMVYPYHVFPLMPGVYTYTEEYCFRAGSYFYYNEFRDWLSWQVLGKSARRVWEEIEDNNPATYPRQGIVWLVDFSDCQGVISGERCKVILADLLKHRDALFSAASKLQSEDGPWFREKVEDWVKALTLAADFGFMHFG